MNESLCTSPSTTTTEVGVSDHAPWPLRNSKVFYALNAVMERCNDITELVNTLRDFRLPLPIAVYITIYFKATNF